MNNPEERTYIGDGVYVRCAGNMLVIETARGSHQDVIYLDPEVFEALKQYAQEAEKYYADLRAQDGE